MGDGPGEFHVIPGGLAVLAERLVRRLVIVAPNDDARCFGLLFLCSDDRGGEEGREAERQHYQGWAGAERRTGTGFTIHLSCSPDNAALYHT